MPVPLFQLDLSLSATLDRLEAFQRSPVVDQIMWQQAPPAYVPGVRINQVWDPATRTYRDPTQEEILAAQVAAIQPY